MTFADAPPGRYPYVLDGNREPGEGEVVVVANQVPGILRIYHGSPWAGGGHWRMMRRLEGARVAGNRLFAGLQSKATAIPWAALMPDE